MPQGWDLGVGGALGGGGGGGGGGVKNVFSEIQPDLVCELLTWMAHAPAQFLIISKCMHGLQACLFKYITVAAFHIYAQRDEEMRNEDAAKTAEFGGHALNSHGNYIIDRGKSWKNHGIVFLNF